MGRIEDAHHTICHMSWLRSLRILIASEIIDDAIDRFLRDLTVDQASVRVRAVSAAGR
jgi:hypothetical protein